MKPQELKQLIKVYVRECLTEVLAEKFIQNIVQEAVVEGLKGAKVIQEAPQSQPQRVQRKPNVVQREHVSVAEDASENALKKLGVKDPLMESIFRDTLQSNNPLVTGQEASGVEVPESALEKIGLFNKNWDKFIK